MLKEARERMIGAVSSIGESVVDKHQRFGNLILKIVGLPEPMTTREVKALERRRELAKQALAENWPMSEFEEKAGIQNPTDEELRKGWIRDL